MKTDGFGKAFHWISTKMLLKFCPLFTVYLGTESRMLKRLVTALFGIGIFCMEIYQLKQLTCLRSQRFHFVDIFKTSFWDTNSGRVILMRELYSWLQVSDFFTRLIQRVVPKSYQQAFGEVHVTQKFLENFSGDQVGFDQIFCLLT